MLSNLFLISGICNVSFFFLVKRAAGSKTDTPPNLPCSCPMMLFEQTTRQRD